MEPFHLESVDQKVQIPTSGKQFDRQIKGELAIDWRLPTVPLQSCRRRHVEWYSGGRVRVSSYVVAPVVEAIRKFITKMWH